MKTEHVEMFLVSLLAHRKYIVNNLHDEDEASFVEDVLGDIAFMYQNYTHPYNIVEDNYAGTSHKTIQKCYSIYKEVLDSVMSRYVDGYSKEVTVEKL